MQIDTPTALLGGLTPSQFMRRHWQKKPLLVRQALPGFVPDLGRSELMRLAEREDVESRLIVRRGADWHLQHGPFGRKQFPPLKQADWTFLVQGIDGFDAQARQLLQQFRFVPDARLDDVMASYASDGGGVGPHFDSYDVFLIQVHGQRRWRIGQQKDLTLQDNAPLKILQHFEPQQEFVLEPGDMLYLPPKYAHDGAAIGECMTWSVGFRAPSGAEMAREMLLGLADTDEDEDSALYRDAQQLAVTHPAQVPPAMLAFAQQALQRAQKDPHVLALVLGEYLTQPKSQIGFESSGQVWRAGMSAQLDARTRMAYDDRHVFINGEGFRVGGRDGRLLRQLADARHLTGADSAKLSEQAAGALTQWAADGWLHTS